MKKKVKMKVGYGIVTAPWVIKNTVDIRTIYEAGCLEFHL
jgi:hypothetical protein